RSSSALTPPAKTLSTWSRTICAIRDSLVLQLLHSLITKAVYRYRRVEDPIRSHNPNRSGEHYRPRQRQVVPRAADGDGNRAGLDDARTGQAGERDPVGVQPERDPAGLTGRERHPGEPGQPAHRPDERGDRVAEVQLHHLRACPGARVAHGAGDL